MTADAALAKYPHVGDVARLGIVARAAIGKLLSDAEILAAAHNLILSDYGKRLYHAIGNDDQATALTVLRYAVNLADSSSPSPEGARTVAESTHADSPTQLAEDGTSSVDVDLLAKQGEPEITRGSSTHPKCVQTVNRYGLSLRWPEDLDCNSIEHEDRVLHRLPVDCGDNKASCLHHEYLPAGGKA